MTIALVILTLFLAVTVFLIFTPVRLRIDTYNGQYYVQVWGVAKCWFVWEDGPLIRVKVPFYSFTVDPLKKGKKKKKVKPEKKKKRRVGNKDNTLRKVLRVIRSFRLKEFRLDLDTSDVIWNGYLYPVFFFLNSEKTPMSINYNGKVGLVVYIETRIARILRAYLM